MEKPTAIAAGWRHLVAIADGNVHRWTNEEKKNAETSFTEPAPTASAVATSASAGGDKWDSTGNPTLWALILGALAGLLYYLFS